MPRLPRIPKAGETIVHPPTGEEVSAVLRAAPPHIRLALALCCDAGLRAGEVPLTGRLHKLLSDAAKKPHGLTSPVAPSARGKVWGEPSLLHAFRRVLKKLGLPKPAFTTFATIFVSEAFRAGGGAPTVRDLAGHKHMSVTARYVHSDEDAKRAVIEALDRQQVS
jgi:integrase